MDWECSERASESSSPATRLIWDVWGGGLGV
jgi:hypothetical protein